MLQSMGSQRDGYDLVTEQQPGVQWLRLCFHCRGCGFDPWLVGVLRSHIPYARWRGQNKQTNIWKQGLRDLLVYLCSQQHYLQETNQMSVDSWQINKLGSIHTTECYSVFKKEGDSDTHCNTDEDLGHDAWWNQPDTKGHTLSGSTHRRSLEESDPKRQEVDGGSLGLGEREGEMVFNNGPSLPSLSTLYLVLSPPATQPPQCLLLLSLLKAHLFILLW